MKLRADQSLIERWIRPGAHVLDLGCGNGDLLAFLQRERDVTGYGLEIDMDSILCAMRQNVNVVQHDLNADGLSSFADDSFDYVLMTETLQSVHYPQHLLNDMLRVGCEGIVTFSNFGNWRCRLRLLCGHAPLTPGDKLEWHESSRIHPCTVADFERLCITERIEVIDRIIADRYHAGGSLMRLWPDLFGESAIYRLRRQR